MEQSPRLSLTYLAPSQAQKHVTVNETFRRLDALVQLSVHSRTTGAEPAAPAEGDAYILPTGPTGASWAAFAAGNVAAYQDGAWVEFAAFEGMRAWINDEHILVVYDGASWTTVTGGGGSETAAKFGVNATADATNKLTVKSNAALFDSQDSATESGNDDFILKINKEAAADTASVIFQTAFSGRAEFGLTGDDDFHIKVSADGATWNEAIVVDKDTGNIGVGTNAPGAMLHIEGANGSNPADGDLFVEKEEGYALIFLTNYAAASAFNSPFSVQRRSRGTKAAPTAVVSGDWLGGFSFRGYDGSTFQQRGLINGVVDGTVSGGNVPTALAFQTGTTALTERMRLNSDGGLTVGSPTGGSKGAGTINASAVYDDNSLLTCYVFEQALDGQIDFERWDAFARGGYNVCAHRFAARAGTAHDPLTLDGYARHWREKRHLTSMPNKDAYDPTRGLAAGEWIQRLVETVEIQAVLIEQLNERLKRFETGC